MNIKYKGEQVALIKKLFSEGLSDRQIHEKWVELYGEIKFSTLRKKRQRLRLRRSP